MKCNFILVKLKDKNNINLNKSKIHEIFKLSIGNNIKYFNYNKNKKEFPNIQIIIYLTLEPLLFIPLKFSKNNYSIFILNPLKSPNFVSL